MFESPARTTKPLDEGSVATVFNIGGSEMVFLAILALLVFGPQGLPDVAKTVARTIKAFRAAANDLQSEVKTALDLENTGVEKKDDRGQRRRQRALPPSTKAELGTEAIPDDGESASIIGPIAAEKATTDLVPVESSDLTTTTATDPVILDPSTSDPPAAETTPPDGSVTNLEVDDDGPQVPMVKPTRASTPGTVEVESSS